MFLNDQYLKDLLLKLNPQHLEVIDESYKHRNHYTPQDENMISHVKIIIMSNDFTNLTLLARHKLVNQLLSPAFAVGLHAASIKAYTPEEFKSSVMTTDRAL